MRAPHPLYRSTQNYLPDAVASLAGRSCPSIPDILGDRRARELGLALLTETEWMAGWIGVNYPDAARLLDRAGEYRRAKSDRSEAGGTEVRNGQVEMHLLRRTIWPYRWVVRRCKLEGQFERQISAVYLTPFRITDI
jgi:hypothetical protein